MHRLIPSRYSAPPSYSPRGSEMDGTVLSTIADTASMLDDITLLDGATNDRIRTEQRGSIGISTYELVYGIPNAHIVNAAFCYTSEAGARFSDHTRGAWYAAAELKTSIREVAYHRAKHLGEIIVPNLPGEKPDTDSSTYDDWQSDFRTTFHELSPPEDYAGCLQSEPVPECYAAGQQLARKLIEQGSNGILYPSVRRTGHLCLACFRPALVYNPRREKRLAITLKNIGAEYAVSVSETT
jgi:RES domain